MGLYKLPNRFHAKVAIRSPQIFRPCCNPLQLLRHKQSYFQSQKWGHRTEIITILLALGVGIRSHCAFVHGFRGKIRWKANAWYFQLHFYNTPRLCIYESHQEIVSKMSEPSKKWSRNGGFWYLAPRMDTEKINDGHQLNGWFLGGRNFVISETGLFEASHGSRELPPELKSHASSGSRLILRLVKVQPNQ